MTKTRVKARGGCPARAGERNRKGGARHPSGQLRRPSQAERERQELADAAAPRQEQILRRFGIVISASDACKAPLGVELQLLRHIGLISPRQCDAGQAYAQIYHRFRTAIGAPVPWPACCEPGPTAPEIDRDTANRRRADWQALQGRLQPHPLITRDLESVCIHNHHMTSQWRLQTGLTIVADHLELPPDADTTT